MKSGTAINTKTIQRRCLQNLALSYASQPKIHSWQAQAMKKKRLGFGKRYASWDRDIEIETFSINENTLIFVFDDCIMHYCFANLHLLCDLIYKKL